MENETKSSKKKVILLSLLFVALLSVISYLTLMQYQASQNIANLNADVAKLQASKSSITSENESNKKKLNSLKSKTVAQSAEQQVLELAKCDYDSGASCQLEWDQNLARVTISTVEGTGASEIYYRDPKVDGSWVKIWSGNGDIPQATIEKYKLPETWTGPTLE